MARWSVVMAWYLVAFLPFAAGAAAADDSVVYRHVKVFDADGNLVSETTDGDPWVDGPRGEKEFLFDSTVGPDGTVYLIEGGTGDDPETGGSVFESLIRVAGVEYVPLADRIAALKEGGADPRYIQAVIDGHDPSRRAPETVTIYPGFLDRLGGLDPYAEIEVAVILAEQPPLDLPRVDLDEDTGIPGFTMDAYIEKLAAIEERKQLNAVLQRPVADFIEDSGGRVTSRYWILNALHAVVPVWLVEEIAALEEVGLVHEVGATELFSADFNEVRRSAQTEMFRKVHNSTTFEGDRSSGRSSCANIAVAVIDSEDFNPEHVAYRDAGASMLTRIYDRYFCTSSGCVAGLNPDATGDHGAFCAGIVAQDLMDGQDPNYTTDASRNLRSGIAAEASVILVHEASSGKIEAIEKAAELGADVISMSIGSTGDGYCPSEEEARGIDDLSDAANAAVIDAGVFFSQAAGNQNDPDTYCSNDEQVVAPGNASAVFAVGAYFPHPDGGSYENPYGDFDGTGNLTNTSSSGPTWDGRVKPDLVAPTEIEYVIDVDANQGSTAYHTSGDGTSFAAPVVAGSAAIFKDWLIYAYGASFANNPRRIFVNLLNFGDRKNITTSGYDYFSNHYGAGRLRMRLPETKAMDAPYRWITGNVTLSDGQSQQVWLGPAGNVTGPIDDAVNFLKIALWWHEPNTASGQTKALISGRLYKEISPGAGVYTMTTHDSNGDQKVHFIYDDLESNFVDFDGNRRYYFRIVADSIPGSETRTVYYSALWEDLDRDDVDGPCLIPCAYGDTRYPLLYR